MIPVFLSFPKAHLSSQQAFIDRLISTLRARGLEPRTLGVSDYDMQAPLKGIRRLLLESNGLICLAFRRALAPQLVMRSGADLPGVKSSTVTDVWLTSPYCQVEPAMALHLGLPILVFREAGVLADGILEKGVLGAYMPEFDLSIGLDAYFASEEFTQLLAQWEGQIRMVRERKGSPPMLFA